MAKSNADKMAQLAWNACASKAFIYMLDKQFDEIDLGELNAAERERIDQMNVLLAELRAKSAEILDTLDEIEGHVVEDDEFVHILEMRDGETARRLAVGQ